jgi:3'(2'), 5'-bisphosphate nucleotidase
VTANRLETDTAATTIDTPLALLRAVRGIARRAGEVILQFYRPFVAGAALDISRKADDSPLTAADLAAHRLIAAELAALTPDIPLLSEESAEIPYAERSRWSRFWLVDPLDGTKEFLARNGEFTVNIALIDAHRAVLGVVHVPAQDVDYWGLASGGAWRAQSADDAGTPIGVAAQLARPLRVVGSRSHRDDALDAVLARLGPHELVTLGSSLKFCLLAEGRADLYPRFGPTSEWDTAAAQAVLQGAGGAVLRLDGTALEYNRKVSLLNPPFVALAPAARDHLPLFAEVIAP